MLPRCTLAGYLGSHGGRQWPLWGRVSAPHRNKCQYEEGRGQTPTTGGASSWPACPPWRLWQVCRCRSPGAQALRSLHDASSLGLCPPRGLRPRMWAGEGRLAGGAGWPAIGEQAGDTAQVLFPGTWSPGGARRCPALRRRTFCPSGGCAGTESWKKPFPGSA